MAGMRIGFAIGSRELIACMQDVKYSVNSYTMNRPSILVGKAVMEDEAYFRENCKKIIQTREWAKEELEKLGFTLTDSKTNFLFASHRSVPAKELFQMLREKHIFVRYFDRPRIDNYLRITIGTKEEMEILLAALRTYLNK